MELNALINHLLPFLNSDFTNTPNGKGLEHYGLQESPAAAQMRAVMDVPAPNASFLSPWTDPLHAQTCLAYQLTRFGYSSAVTLGPSFQSQISDDLLSVQTPLAFDHSAENHVATQQAMWGRTLEYTDKLITLLQQTPTGDGDTMWDRSLVYIATDFGRTKDRNTPGQSLNTTPDGPPVRTGHHTNNGCVLISPRIKAGLYGGVDPDTLLTYGMDRNTGTAMSGPENLLRIQDVYTAICEAMDAPFPGMESVPALKR